MSENDESFNHLLLTRFNLDYSQRKNVTYQCDHDWHVERFELFNKFCLASVTHQSIHEFTWIIFFNQEKKLRYKPFIEKTQRSLDNIHFIFVEPREDHRKKLKNYIRENCSADYLITTRMDNDDAIANHFIESIQNKFKEIRGEVDSEGLVINTGVGYQYETKFPYRKTHIEGYKYSPFITLVSKKESRKSFRNVLEHAHLGWKNVVESKELENDSYWIQVVHGQNRANQILSLNLLLKIDDDKFVVLNDLPKNSTWIGLLMLPIQIIITIVNRIRVKVKKTL